MSVGIFDAADGRLEGEGRPSPPGSDIFMSTDNTTKPNNGAIWLGCRLGVRGVRVDRFTGEMDELFIANRALQPHEIVRLMKADLWDAVTAGKLALPIDRTFPLDDAIAAQAHMKANQHFGKIALVM
jgi:NADPH:quinone reductase-like Zn-dependent oxidoreductase